MLTPDYLATLTPEQLEQKLTEARTDLAERRKESLNDRGYEQSRVWHLESEMTARQINTKVRAGCAPSYIQPSGRYMVTKARVRAGQLEIQYSGSRRWVAVSQDEVA